MPQRTRSSNKRTHEAMDEKRLHSSSSSQSIDTDPYSVSSTESNGDITVVMPFIEQIFSMLKKLIEVVETQTQEISSQEDHITRLNAIISFLQTMPAKLAEPVLAPEEDVFSSDTQFDFDVPDLDEIETGVRLGYRFEAEIKMEGVHAKVAEIESMMQQVNSILQDTIDNQAHQSKHSKSDSLPSKVRDELAVLEEYRKSVPVLRQRLVELTSRSAEGLLEKKLASATNSNSALKKEIAQQKREIEALTKTTQAKDQTITALQEMFAVKALECDAAKNNENTAKNKLLQYHTMSAERLEAIFQQKNKDLQGLQDLLNNKPDTPEAKRVAQHALDAAKRETQMQNNLSKQACLIGNLREKVLALECQLAQATSKATPILTAFSTQPPANSAVLKSESKDKDMHAAGAKPAMGRS